MPQAQSDTAMAPTQSGTYFQTHLPLGATLLPSWPLDIYTYIYMSIDSMRLCLYVSGCTLNTWHWHRDVIKLLMSVRTSEEFMYVYYMQTLSAPAFSGWTDKKSLDETFGLVIFYFLYRRKCFQFHFLQVIFRGTIKTFQAVGRFYVF